MNDIILDAIATYKDERGIIKTLIDGISFSSILSINSEKDSKRANHVHFLGEHLCILLSGEIDYFERPYKSDIKPIKIKIFPWQMFYTKKLQEHCMVFLEKSEFLCFSTISRSQDRYELDTLRLGFDLSLL